MLPSASSSTSSLELFFKKVATSHASSTHASPKKPLIILHGYLASISNLLPTALGISKNLHGKEAREIFVVDQRNHGHSPHSPIMSYLAMSYDLKQFLDTHGIKKAALLGHSMGAKTALCFASLFPSRVEKVVVADMHPQAKEEKSVAEKYAGYLYQLKLEKFQTRAQVFEALAEKIPYVHTRNFLLKNLVIQGTKTKKLYWQCNMEVLSKQGHFVRAGIYFESPSPIPMLFIRGGQSSYILKSEIPDLQKKFPLAQFEHFAESGHWLHWEESKRFSDVIANFLSQPQPTP